MIQTISIDVGLNPTQYKVRKAKEKELFVIAGLGSGKSYLGGLWVLERALIEGSVGFMGAPTKDVLKNSTMKQVQSAWESFGIHEWTDYVVGRLPPEEWGVKPFSSLNQYGVITFEWGSYLIIDGLDNFNKHRGTEFDYTFVDEFRDVKQEARDVLIGRLRGKVFRDNGNKHQSLWVTTPPEDFEMIEEAIKGDDVFYATCSSWENRRNLPADYIPNLLKKYDHITAQREIYGKLINANNKPFIYTFDRSKHLFDELPVFEDHYLYVSFDFNIEPMTCVCFQFGGTWVNFIDEFSMDGKTHRQVAQEVKDKYAGWEFKVTGDREGYTRQKAVEGNTPMYKEICEVLGVDYYRDCIAPKSNMKIMGERGSRTLCNSVLEQLPNFRIDSSLKGLIKDIEKARVNHLGELDKSRQKKERYLDLLDCFRYAIHTCFPDWFDR